MAFLVQLAPFIQKLIDAGLVPPDIREVKLFFVLDEPIALSYRMAHGGWKTKTSSMLSPQAPVIDKLVASGLMPDETINAIITLPVDDVARVDYTCFATEELLNLIEPEDMFPNDD